MPQPITYLDTGAQAVILRLEGDDCFRRKMAALGIREQKILRLVAKHPFCGPFVIEIDGREITLGCRMAAHIIAGDL